MQTALEEVGEVVYHIDTWFIAVGVCREFYLTVMQDFLFPKISFFKSQFVYSGPFLESKGMRTIFKKMAKKGKIFGNLGKNVQNLKIF